MVHVQSVEAQNPPTGVVCRFGEVDVTSGIGLVTCETQGPLPKVRVPHVGLSRPSRRHAPQFEKHCPRVLVMYANRTRYTLNQKNYLINRTMPP
ncbi:hypothetical protein TNCV_1833371 [Trichonephila clavipes]|nr:hypothetical protein TNCV_1833371 [Trichonephila clavipes]